jgi:putative transposase
VSWICEALGVSRSGFHAWLVRAPSARARSDEAFGAKVCASFISSYRTYGARRVWHELLAEGHHGLHRIERLMRVRGLKARPRRRGLPKDDGLRSLVADNLLDRQFTAEAPNQRWIADFTYIWTAEGWLYVAVVIDLFSRRVVGWSMSNTMTARLVTDALMMAIWRRGKPDALLHHSDQGSQYTSEQFQRLMADHGVTCSMSRSGKVWDNAVMESFFSSMKTERIGRKTYRMRNHAKADVSIISSAFTIRRAGTRPWAISAPWTSSGKRRQLNLVSIGPAAAHRRVRLISAGDGGFRGCGDGVEAGGTCRVDQGPAVRSLSEMLRKSAASVQPVAKAMRMRLAVSTTRAATLSKRRRRVENSAFRSGLVAGMA